MIEVFEKAAELLRDGRTIAVACIVSASGSTPRNSGARIIVTAEGDTYFTVGGGALEAAVVKDALRAIESGRNAVKEYNLGESAPEGLGMACGGKATIVIEVVSPPERLVIIGAGHVGRAVARCAEGLGFAIVVVDDRSECLDPGRFPKGVSLHRAAPDYEGELPGIDENDYVVIVTRSHETDLNVLRAVMAHRSAYVGMIGSRRKAELTLASLKAEGVSPGVLERVRSPIGLDIGSKAPEEIAISILAEIIRVRNAVCSAI